MSHISVPPFLKVVLLSALVAGLVPAGAAAQSGSGASGPRAAAVVMIPGAAAPFDWLAKKRLTRSATVQDAVLVSTDGQAVVKRQRFFGKGSWICSPAGFGKKSRCFAR